jgi:hypothetical protein
MNLAQRIKSEIPVGNLGQYATLLVVIGITLSIGMLILTTMYNTESMSPVTSYNQTVTLTNGTYTTLTNERGVAITSVGNATKIWSVGTTNFTMLANTSSTQIKPTPVGWGATVFKSDSYWVVYTYQSETTASEALTAANSSVGIFGDWLVIIAIVIVAVVVLSLIKYL